MRIIAKGTLRDFWLLNPPSEFPLLDWYNTVKQCKWNTPNDVKQTYGNASIVANDRVVFNIKGNDYRLVTEIDYDYQLVFIIWVGTHRAYDKIDVTKIEYDG
jgi:mRNA interferase HigB